MKQKRPVSKRRLPSKSSTSRRSHPSRPVHKRILLHPASVVVLLIFGVVIVGSTIPANADSFLVSAEVPAPQLTQPAVITTPTDGSTLTDSAITVSGTCPDNSYVDLSDNSIFVGVSQCTNQTFSVDVDLVTNLNQLLPQDYNITNSAGPSSTDVNVYYEPQPAPTLPFTSPVTTTPTTTTTTTQTPTASVTAQTPFYVTAPYQYQVYNVNQSVNYTLTIGGGSSPYAVTVQWGDGVVTTYVRNSPGPFVVTHSYSSSGEVNTTKVIQVDVVDSSGKLTHFQLTAIIKPAPKSSLATTTGTTNPIFKFFDNLRKYLWVIWPIYGVTMLTVFSYWLGERKLIINVKSKRRKLRLAHTKHRA
jgi:hypothetical protein